MNKKIIWGVVIAVIALGGLLLYKYTGIFGPIIQLYSKNSSETSDWKTYTNNELGYSIKYPANYKITDNNVLASNKFVSAISLQISDPVNKAIEFNPLLIVDIIKQPYIVKDKIFINAKEYANYRYESLQNLSIVEKVKGDPSIVEVSGMTQSEMSSELLQLKMLVGINNGLVYEVSYYPVDYKHFYEIAETFKFTSPTNTVQSKEQKLIYTSREVLAALKNKDYNKLETLSSKDGLSFNENSDSLDLSKNDVSKDAISEIPINTTKYMWGYTDGKGDEIRLTLSDYINQWMYNRDYINAPKVVVNQTAYPPGNTANNIATYSQGRNYVAFHFDSTKEYPGLTWSTMYLIFDEENGNYMLRGIIKANWTI